MCPKNVARIRLILEDKSKVVQLGFSRFNGFKIRFLNRSIIVLPLHTLKTSVKAVRFLLKNQNSNS